MKELLKKPMTEWTRDELIAAKASVRRTIEAWSAGDLADMRVARDDPDPQALGGVLDDSFKRQQLLGRLSNDIAAELAKRPIPIIEHPRDDRDWLLYHRTHGWITGRFEHGHFDDHHEYGREYNGPVWVLGDDIEQVEVEETQDPVLTTTILYLDGPITHFLPCPAKPGPEDED